MEDMGGREGNEGNAVLMSVCWITTLDEIS